MGHKTPFDFDFDYEPAAAIRCVSLSGTPQILNALPLSTRPPSKGGYRPVAAPSEIT